MKRFRIGLLGALLCTSATAMESSQWHFRVYLDDAPIGWQRFVLTQAEDEREMRVEARLTVKVLGLTFYRYAHNALERWRGDCLQSVTSSTDDNGEKLRVDSETRDGVLIALSGNRRVATEACPMTFAYWNPAMLQRERLLNTQTGAYEKIAIRKVGEESIRARGDAVRASRYRIEGLPEPIELWYSGSGDWLGLSSRVAGGKVLRYERE